MKAPADCRLIGRWRIVKADLWDRDYLDLCGPARLTITAQGGEIAFGAMEAGLEVEYARDSIGFRWAGCDDGDEVQGEGTAELLDDGTIEIEFAFDNGDEAVLKAKRTLLQQPARRRSENCSRSRGGRARQSNWRSFFSVTEPRTCAMQGPMTLAANMQRKLAPVRPVFAARSSWLRLLALAEPRYFGSDQINELAVVAGPPERPEAEFVFELLPTRFDSIPPHDRLLRDS